MTRQMPRVTRPEAERFWAKVDAGGDCWEWLSYRDRDGYGRFCSHKGANALAHRFAWEKLVGNIPEGLELDHLCRNRACVNPDHMEVVTHRENCTRGYPNLSNLSTVWKKRRAQTHCQRGHEFTVENTGRQNGGYRYCRTCHGTTSHNRYLATKLRRAS